MNIRKTRVFHADIATVWEAITDEAKLNQWFMKARFKAEPGYQFEFHDTPQGKWDGRLWGEVTEVVEQKTLAYTWQGNQMKNDTLVTWKLESVAEGTRVTLEHTGFKGLNDNMIGFFHLFGWKKYFKNLLAFLH